MVCLGGDQTSQARWPLACIEEVVKGEDGLVRVVIARMSRGKYKRPNTKIVPLLQEGN